MSTALSHSSAHLSHSTALRVSQKASSYVQDTPPSGISLGLWSKGESSELWTTLENLVLSCLRTGDEKSAKTCLERLTQRFGADNERLMALTGIFKEAVAHNDSELQPVLEEYEQILQKDPTNMPISKRRIALLKSLGRITEAISALTRFLESSPTDAEAWSEISDLYVSQGLYQQAIFALEEVLLVAPFAWNIHARLGEVLYMASQTGDTATDQLLNGSVQRFSRSIELCNNYLRAYYGLKVVTDCILTRSFTGNEAVTTESEHLSTKLKTIERLNEIATAKLSEIVRNYLGGDADWQGYDKAEITATQDLLYQSLDTSMTR
ncbi:hypothetical protein K3495_g1679 [Podosphaera aphanis]|nr:hypothetical protein K3495_g1679 [Podosphaera aphanis]